MGLTRPVRSSPRIPRHDTYFERIATELWDGRWETIVATRSAGDRERLFIEATILCKYGKSLSLRGTPEKVRDILASARAACASALHLASRLRIDDPINPREVFRESSLPIVPQAPSDIIINESAAAA